jgi:hypothetical protein
MVRKASGALKTWAANPGVRPALLREALDEVITLEKTRPPISHAYKAEYINIMGYINQSQGLDPVSHRNQEEHTWLEGMPVYEAVRWFLQNERERNRRVVRLLFANWLAQCDKPWMERAASTGPFRICDDPAAPLAARSLPAEELAHWVELAPVANDIARTIPRMETIADQDRLDWGSLIVALAEQLHLRQYGFVPVRPEELVGRYLKALPEGFDPDLSRTGPRPILPEIHPVYGRLEPGVDLLRSRARPRFP